jgi:hypothetical protein
MKVNIIPLQNCQGGEYIFNEYGLIVGSRLNHEYYKLYCLIMNKGSKIVDIYYPFLFFSTPEQLMEIIKIGLLAEKEKLHYLDLNMKMPDKQEYVLVYRDPKDLENAYLRAYLFKKGSKLLKTQDSNKDALLKRMSFTWLRNHLSHLPHKISKGTLLFIYYRYGFTDKIMEAYRKLYSEDLKNFKEEINRRYEFILDYDNFADFNKKMVIAKQMGLKLKKTMRLEPEFEKFKKTVKVKEFIFPMEEAMKTGILTKEMLDQIKIFKKSLQ